MSARCSPERCQELLQRVRNQCIVARWLGEQAVGVVRRELAQAWEAGRTTARTPADAGDPAAAPAANDVDPAADVADVPDAVAATDTVAAGRADFADVLAVAARADELDVTELPARVAPAPAAPFEGYDTLPASHIVQRLRRMSPDELRRTAAYETQHRGRTTVLGMVEQLLDD